MKAGFICFMLVKLFDTAKAKTYILNLLPARLADGYKKTNIKNIKEFSG
jgi:hypothetical protein